MSRKSGAKPQVQDLVVLTADKNAETAIRSLLERHHAMGIRALKTQFFTHPERDAGVVHRGHDFIRPFVHQFAHAIVLLDLEGSGKETLGREGLERWIEERLQNSGWQSRAAAIVLDPELEIWVWSDSPHVDEQLGWKGKSPSVRQWLVKNGLLASNDAKPNPPKDAMEAALRVARKPRSSAIYGTLAKLVSLERCTDPAFEKFKRVLREWFPIKGPRRTDES